MSLNIFQSSKSALIFAGSVILTTLVLVGPKEGSGVLGSATQGYLGERERIIEGAAAMSNELSTLPPQPAPRPSAWDANPMVDHNLGPIAAGEYGSGPSFGGSQQYANPEASPILSEPINSGGGNELALPQETPRNEAVVTSRFIKIEPN
jgi:hypothetical protein